MSPPDLNDAGRGVVVQKPKTDVYTWLLLVALFAIIMACVCLYIEIGVRYGGDIKATGAAAPSAAIHYTNAPVV